MTTRRKKIHKILACLIGNTLEWFDYTLYGTFSTTLQKLFLPPSCKSSQLIIYIIFALGFLSRPFGGVFLGHIGDKFGRKTTLLLSILLMSIPTFLLGILPTYNQIGISAVILLAAIRILQGIAIGGEFTGSMVYLVEQADSKSRGFYGSWSDFGSPFGVLLGFLCAQFLVNSMSSESFEAYGWRIPFIGSIFIAIIGAILRKNLEENNTFRCKKEKSNLPFIETIKKHKKTTILAALICAFGGVSFYLLLTFLHNFLKLSGFITQEQAYEYAILSNFAMIFSIPLSGYISDFIGRKKVIIAGVLLSVISAFVMFNTISQQLIAVHLYAQILFAFSLGIFFGARAAFFVEAYPSRVRCTALAVAFGLSHSLFAGCTPAFAEFLYQKFNDVTVLFYVVLTLGILCIGALYQLPDRTGEELLH